MARTTLDLDETLLAQAMAVEGASSKTDVIERALALLIQTRARQRLLAGLGSYDIDLTLDDLARLRTERS